MVLPDMRTNRVLMPYLALKAGHPHRDIFGCPGVEGEGALGGLDQQIEGGLGCALRCLRERRGSGEPLADR